MHEKMFQSDSRIAFKGQVFSAPMDWNRMQEQLEDLDSQDVHIVLPVTGAILASRVQVQISAGLVDLNKCIKEATVRRNVVVQLIRMHRDAGHPDYQRCNMADVALKARELADTDEPTIPAGLADILEEDSDDPVELGVDKAATPAERIWNIEDLCKHMERARPTLMLSQRDSDANKEIEASRCSAFSKFPRLELRTGSNLIDQFQGSYIPRVNNLTLPRYVGGPDLYGRPRWRRQFKDAPPVQLNKYTSMMAQRVEAQIRWDWDLIPGIWSLCFATQVNLGISLAIRRALRQGGEADESHQYIGQAAAKIYALLWQGEYTAEDGQRRSIKGDISKLPSAIGLTDTQRALMRNYFSSPAGSQARVKLDEALII